MLPLLMVFLSGFTGALYGLSYKLRSHWGYPIYRTLFLFSTFSVLFSLLFLIIFHEPLYSIKSLILGVPYGLCMVISLSLYFNVTDRAKLNISWTVIQFSVLIPFAFSIFWYGERVEPIAVAGTACIFVSLLFFGLGKKDAPIRRAILDMRTSVMLLLSFLFTGLSMCIPKIYAVIEPDAGSFPLFLYRGLSMVPCSFLLMRFREGALEKREWKPGLFLLSAELS